MSGGLFGLVTAADRTANAGLGAPPGRKGKDGVSVFDAFQVAGSASFHLVLSNGQDREIFIPPGAPGRDGITPTFTQGTIQNVANGGTGSFALVPTATPGLYSYNVTLVAGPMPLAFPVPYAAGISATPGPPATQVVYNKSTWACTTAHTTTSTFDASKWICTAQGGADGNGNVSGTASSFDLEIIVSNGATSTNIKGSGVKFGTAAGNAIRLDPTSGKLPAVDGSQLTGLAQGRYSRVVFLTTSQTWTAPANIKGRVTVIGAGGSGGAARGSPLVLATGGASGGIAYKAFTALAGASFTATIGAGGASVSPSSGGANGSAGGASSFTGTGVSVTANGGAGGLNIIGATGTARTAAGAAGGTATGGDLNYTGGGSGAASIGAGVTNGNAAATGGGAVSFSGIAYASGAATINTSNGSGGAASGGAGVGANSADAVLSSGGQIVSGGGSGSGPSLVGSSTQYGGPDIFGVYGDSYTNTGFNSGASGFATLPPTAFTVFDFNGRGGSATTSGAGQPGDAGCGGGASIQVSNTANGGTGGLFAGGGGAAGVSGSAFGGNAGAQRNLAVTYFGGGGGGAASLNGTGVTSGSGGAGLIIIEYDLV